MLRIAARVRRVTRPPAPPLAEALQLMAAGYMPDSHGFWRDYAGRDSGGLYYCEACACPTRTRDCDNPGCPEGKPPAVAAEIRARHAAWAAQRAADDARVAERERLRRAHGRMVSLFT